MTIFMSTQNSKTQFVAAYYDRHSFCVDEKF